MRSVLVALALVAGTSPAPAFALPASADAAAVPKVVIVVGPWRAQRPHIVRTRRSASTEALKYTPNVVLIYSPNATWHAAAPSALQGASIVVYMGHGNGFPSPYAPMLQPDREDGFGLNPMAGATTATTRYWGEQYVAGDIRLAPNAVVC